MYANAVYEILSIDNVFLLLSANQIEAFVIFKGQKHPIDHSAGNIHVGFYQSKSIHVPAINAVLQ